MASLLCSLSFCSPSSKPLLPTTHASFPSPSLSLKPKTLLSTTSISGSPLSLPRVLSPSRPSPIPLTISAAKGYKMKTHKASAKRFRVTGTGKIVRRRSGKQHLLEKKNTKRKLRLSKMVTVNRSDYDNVIGALPYLKVDRSSK